MTVDTKDDRIEKILEQILKFTRSDFGMRGVISEKGDEIDAIVAGLNTLGEEWNRKKEVVLQNEKRLNAILEVLLKYTILDFSEKAQISEKGDEIDATAAGINTLVDELAYQINKAKESEEKFRLLVSNIKEYAIFMLNADGTIATWNKGAELINGYTATEIIGKPISLFYTDDEKAFASESLKIANKNGRFEGEAWHKRKNNSLFWAEISITALYDKKGLIKGYSKVIHDITQRKNAEIELKQKSDELAHSNQELEQFAYVASHDLQEPLRMVTSYLQLLSKRYKDKLDDDANEFIYYAVDGSNRMRVLINSLLEYSRVNRLKPFEEINTKALLKNVFQDLNDQIKESKTTIKTNTLFDIYGDPVLISRLFQNLIANAIKFKSTKRPQIIISCEKKRNEYLFSVKDNGIGIQKEYQEKVFVIFQRLHSKEKYPGTGIGLAICKKIVERHNGKIWIESELGKGSTFYFTIKRDRN